MQQWYNFILKIKPDGKAFRSILFSKIFYEVLAYVFNAIKEYLVYTINDQVWYVNSNFNPEPWEQRYEIVVPEDSTLDERREFVKSYMLFPQSSNRLSRDYIYNSIIEAGFEFVNVEYNSLGADDGILRANDIGDETSSFSVGSLTYNSFILSGILPNYYYYANLINLVMSLKPLQVVVYDKITFEQAIAIDDTLTLAIDDTLTLAIDQI